MDTTYIEHSGFRFHIRLPEGYQDVKVLTEVITEDTYGVKDMKAHGFEPQVIVDIGGHIGAFGVLANSLWPKAKLVAVEPDPLNYELYIKNINENRREIVWENMEAVPCPSPTVINAAVSYDEAKNHIVSGMRTSGGGFLRTEEEAKKCINGVETRCSAARKVTTITLEEVTKDIERVDLVKIDCEGGEWDILLNYGTPEKILFMMGETHVRKSFWDVPYREPNDSVYWRSKIWEVIKRRFHHLNFNYEFGRRSLFQAGPKVAC